jgi:hypothetical protein
LCPAPADLHASGRERAQAVRHLGAGRGQQEGGLGLIELSGSRAHGLLVDVVGIGDDGEPVAC